MRLLISLAAAALVLIAQSGFAATVSCDDLKAQVSKKIEAKGVKNATLEVLAKDAIEDGIVVGTCEGASKKLIYRKGK